MKDEARMLWFVERAGSAPALPQYLSEDDSGSLQWAGDLEKALCFAERHLAEVFCRQHVTDSVCIVDLAVNDLSGWAAENVALRRGRDELDAMHMHRQATAFATAI